MTHVGRDGCRAPAPALCRCICHEPERDRDYDALTDREAESILDELWERSPELVELVTESTLIASPLAGPIRILREVDSVLTA